MTIHAQVNFPIYFSLEGEREIEYRKLKTDEEREAFLFDIASEYLDSSTVTPYVESILFKKNA